MDPSMCSIANQICVFIYCSRRDSTNPSITSGCVTAVRLNLLSDSMSSTDRVHPDEEDAIVGAPNIGELWIIRLYSTDFLKHK